MSVIWLVMYTVMKIMTVSRLISSIDWRYVCNCRLSKKGRQAQKGTDRVHVGEGYRPQNETKEEILRSPLAEKNPVVDGHSRFESSSTAMKMQRWRMISPLTVCGPIRSGTGGNALIGLTARSVASGGTCC